MWPIPQERSLKKLLCRVVPDGLQSALVGTCGMITRRVIGTRKCQSRVNTFTPPLPSAFPAYHAPREMRLTCKCNEWKFSWSDIVQHKQHYWAIALQFVVDFQGGSWSRTLPHSYSSQLHSYHNLSSLSALQSVSSVHSAIVTITSLLLHFAKCQESSRVFHNRTHFTTIPKQKTKALCWEIFL